MRVCVCVCVCVCAAVFYLSMFFSWLIGWLGVMAYQPFLGYLMPNPFLNR